MKHRIKCDQPGCTFVAEHDSSNYVRCIIGRHKSIIHKIRGKMYAYQKNLEARNKLKQVVKQVVNSQPESATPAEPEAMNIPNFCPNCGCNLRAVTAALNMRRGRHER